MLRGVVKGRESVRCWVLGLCAEDEEGQPRAHPVIPSAVCDCRASLQQGCAQILQLLDKMLLFFFCAYPPASKYHWILILDSHFPSFFFFFFWLLWLEQWIFTGGFIGVNLSGFVEFLSLSQYAFKIFLCSLEAVWPDTRRSRAILLDVLYLNLNP